MGNKNSLGKNIGNKNAYGKTRGSNNGNWKGGIRTVKHQEELAGRPKPKVCELCYTVANRIHFDHDHNTGLFRGWICLQCNVALGLVKDNPKLLRRMADYLELQNESTRPRVILNLMSKK